MLYRIVLLPSVTLNLAIEYYYTDFNEIKMAAKWYA